MACLKLAGLAILSVILPCRACRVLTLKASPCLAAESFTVAAAGRFGWAPLAACVTAVAPAARTVTATAAVSFLERKCILQFGLGEDRMRGSTHATPTRFAFT